MVSSSVRPASATTSSDAPAATSKRDERRARQHDLARTQLLDAAEEVLGEKGVYVATIKEIADRAEYSVGSVYSFFESKDELLVAVMARRGVEMTAGVVTAARAATPPLERLVAVARYEVEFFRARPAFARLYLRSSSIGSLLPDTPRAREVDAMLTDAMRSTADIFREGQRAGVLCAGDPAALGRLFSGLVSAFQALDAEDPTHVTSHTLDAFATLVARTFSVPIAPTEPDPRGAHADR